LGSRFCADIAAGIAVDIAAVVARAAAVAAPADAAVAAPFIAGADVGAPADVSAHNANPAYDTVPDFALG
jgi:hypothetical protein